MNVDRRIALVGCGAQKLDVEAPARELYTSTLFRLAAEYAEHAFDAWYILSARHGLVTPEKVIAPYNLALRELRQREREGWASRVASHLSLCEPGARTKPRAGSGRLGSGKLGDEQATTGITILAGKDYAQALAWWITADQPLAGLGIGVRLGWLRAELDREQVAVAA